jgi:hypothetical protein
MNTPTYDPREEKKPSEAQFWIKEIEYALVREKTYREQTLEIQKIYEADKAKEFQYNILYSNVETLSPAVYNSTPRPVVKRRYNDDDPLAKAAAGITKRLLEFYLNTNMEDSVPFDELIIGDVASALVAGRGHSRFDYNASIVAVKEATPHNDDEQYEPAHIEETPGAERVTDEQVMGKSIPWNRFLHGYAKKWEDVPWIAFEWLMTKEDLVDSFGPEMAAKVQFAAPEQLDRSSEKDFNKDDDSKGVMLAMVYEIWDKKTKMIRFISPGCADQFLKVTEDPFGLVGFYPMPRPLMFFRRLNSLLPVPLYRFYEEQAKELNRVTVRINKIISALKVRGFYDSTIRGLDKMMEAEDNTLLPADNVASMLQGVTLDKAIWYFPIEKLTAVLQQLYVQRQQIKTVIFEITGIADIMRGATQASETLGAQELKSQWGTLRLKRFQKEVMRYVRDCLRIVAEIAITKFDPKTVRAMTGLIQYPFEEEKQRGMMVLHKLQQSIQQQQMITGQLQPPPPQVQQQIQQLQQQLQQPTIEQLLNLLKDELQRAYRIDIETNSTIDAEATEDKQDTAEVMNAIAQFLNGVAPLIENGTLPFQAAKGLLIGIVRRFKFGDEVEGYLEQMQPPQPQQGKGENPAIEQAKLQTVQAESQARMQELQMEMQFKQQEHQFKMQELQAKQQMMQAEVEIKMRELQINAAASQQKGQMEAESMQRKAAFEAESIDRKNEAAKSAALQASNSGE